MATGDDKAVRQMALNLKSLLCVNSRVGVFPSDVKDRKQQVEQQEFPGVDCDLVFQDSIFLGNE